MIDLQAQPDACDFLTELPSCEVYTIIGLDDDETHLTELIAGDDLDPGNTYGACLEIHGTLVIDDSYDFINCDIKMAEAASIKVKSDEDLRISFCKLSAAESKAWKSIRAESEAKLLVEASCISDAIFGLDIHREASVEAIGNYFDRNYYHVQNSSSGGADEIETVNYFFSANTFDCSSSLIDAYNNAPFGVSPYSFTLAGFYLESSDMRFPANIEGDPENHFKNLMNGILALNCRLRVENCKFEDIQPYGANYPEIAGYGIHHIGNEGKNGLIFQRGFGEYDLDYTYDNVQYAVKSYRSKVDIQQCRMNNVQVGVDVRNGVSREIDIEDNEIDAIMTGIKLYDNAPARRIHVISNTIGVNCSAGQAIAIDVMEMETRQVDALIKANDINLTSADIGIRLDGAFFYRVLNNAIDFESSTRGDAGIKLLNADYNYFYNNDITGDTRSLSVGQTGIYSKSSHNNEFACDNGTSTLAYGLYFELDNPGTDLKESRIRYCQDGLFCTYNTVIGEQRHHANHWHDDFSDLKAYHDGPPFAINESQIIIPTQDENTIFDPRPDVEPGNDVWVIDEGSGSSSVCWPVQDPDAPEDPGPMKFQATDTTIALDQFDMPSYAEAWEWITDRYLYQKMKVDTSYESEHSSLSNFMKSGRADTVSDFVDERRELTDLLNMPDATQTAIEPHIESYADHYDSLVVYDSLHLDTTVTLAQLAHRKDILNLMQTELDAMDSLRKDWHEGVKNQLPGWLSDWNNIDTPNTLASNEQEVMAKYVAILGGTEPDATDSTELVQITQQCPLEGGAAVYAARRMLETVFDTVYTVGTCSGGGSKVASESQPEPLTVYPNPARHQLQIEGLEAGETVSIYDLYGQLMDRFRPEHERMEYDTGPLPPGTYLIRTTDSKTAKFILLR